MSLMSLQLILRKGGFQPLKLNQSWGSSVRAGFAEWLRWKVDEACLFQESPMDYELVCLQVAVGSPTSEPQLWQLSPEITAAVGWRAVHAGSVLHKLSVYSQDACPAVHIGSHHLLLILSSLAHYTSLASFHSWSCWYHFLGHMLNSPLGHVRKWKTTTLL